MAPYMPCYGTGFISARFATATNGIPENTKASYRDRSGTVYKPSSTVILGGGGTGFKNGRRVY